MANELGELQSGIDGKGRTVPDNSMISWRFLKRRND
jgi:hypothetical protein